jgi:hypothetical protein
MKQWSIGEGKAEKAAKRVLEQLQEANVGFLAMWHYTGDAFADNVLRYS